MLFFSTLYYGVWCRRVVLAEEQLMSRQEFSIAYSGSGRSSDHTMDVEVLAPALMALGRLIREARVRTH